MMILGMLLTMLCSPGRCSTARSKQSKMFHELEANYQRARDDIDDYYQKSREQIDTRYPHPETAVPGPHVFKTLYEKEVLENAKGKGEKYDSKYDAKYKAILAKYIEAWGRYQLYKPSGWRYDYVMRAIKRRYDESIKAIDDHYAKRAEIRAELKQEAIHAAAEAANTIPEIEVIGDSPKPERITVAKLRQIFKDIAREANAGDNETAFNSACAAEADRVTRKGRKKWRPTVPKLHGKRSAKTRGIVGGWEDGFREAEDEKKRMARLVKRTKEHAHRGRKRI